LSDYEERSYLSAFEAAKYLGISVKELHYYTKTNLFICSKAASGQLRYDIKELDKKRDLLKLNKQQEITVEEKTELKRNNTTQAVFVKNSMNMDDLKDESVHLMVTSPPYFDAKMYSNDPIVDDLGNIHDLNNWFNVIKQVWCEVYRVLQPGRKAFINIMNLPIRTKDKSHRTLNLVGKTIDVCEEIGFIFKRDIVWHKTNSVRAHFGSYPYPGGILINNMHEFILEFEKPAKKSRALNKYKHVTKDQKERSKLDKEFWLSIKNSDVWVMKPHPSGDNRNHASIFPYELPYRLIKAFSYIGETVLDPFLGSGTTLVVAADLERNGVGYEINPEIAHSAIERIDQNNMQLTLL